MRGRVKGVTLCRVPGLESDDPMALAERQRRIDRAGELEWREANRYADRERENGDDYASEQ